MSIEIMALHHTQIDQLIRDLDLVYQTTLDKLESQAREAILMDKAIRQILNRDNEADPVMEWLPARAISPHRAFKSLAMQVIRAAQGINSRQDALQPIDYEDLLSWVDEPQRTPGESENHELLRKIQYARRKSIQNLWVNLSVRVAPDRNPELALMTAANDLAAAFGVQEPNNFLLPYRDNNPFRTLLMPFRRAPENLEWTIHKEAMLTLVRANHALATVCRVNADTDAAAAIKEATQAVQSRFKASFQLYKPGDRIAAGELVQMNFSQHHIDYRLSHRVWERVWDVLPSKLPEIQFTDAPPGM